MKKALSLLSLGTIKDNRLRNLLRGLMHKDLETGAAIKTLNNLLIATNVGDAEPVFSALWSHPLFSHLPLPDAFPSAPPKSRSRSRLVEIPLPRALQFQLVRLSLNANKLAAAAASLRALNEALINGDAQLALARCAEFIVEFGHSVTILRKIAYLNARYGDDAAVSEYCLAVFKDYGVQEKNIIALSSIDPMDQSYGFIQLRRSMLDYVAGEKINQTSRDLVELSFRPIRSIASDLSSKIQSCGLLSLIDVTALIIMHARKGRLLASPPLAQQIDLLPKELLAAWNELGDMELPLDLWRPKDDDEDRAFSDVLFYRQSLAWFELDKVNTFRELLDPLYLDNKVVDLQTTAHSDQLAERYFAEVGDLGSLAKSPTQYRTSTDHFANDHAGMLVRTAAVVREIRRGARAVDLTSDQLTDIVNNAADLPLLLTTGQLREFFVGSSDQGSTHRYIGDALISDASNLNIDAHRFRQTLQELAKVEYGSDLLTMVSKLTARAQHVGLHLYNTLTEQFLVQLFELFDRTDTAYETRASLLDWFAFEFNDPLSAERASELRVDQRLQQIRGEIDDVRIYVDPVRFGQWLQDNTIEALSSALRTSSVSESDIQEFRQFGTFADQRQPHVMLAVVIKSAFQEFCSSKRYGVDSYIGRRIRHGTLKGFMVSKLTAILDDPKFKRVRHGTAEGYISDWFARYQQNVAHWGNEVFQVNSKQKPQGRIVPVAVHPGRIELVRSAMRDMIKAYADQQSIATVHQALAEHCWRLLEPDLKVIRAIIDEGRRTWGFLTTSDVQRAAGDELRKEAAELCREVNAFTDEAFHSLARWFNKPMNLAPSAPVSLLSQAVIAEVQAQLPSYECDVHREGVDDLVIVGRSYHHIYDFLYVVIYNAAKHGRQPGRITQEIELQQAENSVLMRLSITSQLADGDSADDVRTRISDEMSRDLENAMIEENRSGLRKLLKMKADLKEVEEVLADVSGRHVKITLFIRLGRSE